jgi:hypothetical protein
MSEEFEFKVIRVTRGSPRAREKALTRMAKDGWEFIETGGGAVFSRVDQMTFRRRKSYKAEQRAARREEQRIMVEEFDARRAERKARKAARAEKRAAEAEARGGGRSSSWGHTHEWVDRTTDDDRRNSVSFFECATCGETRTESA